MPIYPDSASKELTWTDWDDGGPPRTTYTLELTGNPQQIHEWYVTQLTSAGWQVDTGPSNASQGLFSVTARSEDGVGVYYIWSGSQDSVSLNIDTVRRLDYRRVNNEAVTWVPLVDPTTRRVFFLMLGAVLAWLVPSRLTVPISMVVRTRRRQRSLDAMVRSSRQLPWEPGHVQKLATGIGTFVLVALLGFPDLFPSTGTFILTVSLIALGVPLAATIAVLVLESGEDESLGG